jgi:hypothetical protein
VPRKKSSRRPRKVARKRGRAHYCIVTKTNRVSSKHRTKKLATKKLATKKGTGYRILVCPGSTKKRSVLKRSR